MADCVCNKCGNGVIDHGEACDTNGDIGCDFVNSICSDDCSFCTCSISSDLIWAGNFSGKRQPIICIILNLISWILKIIGAVALLALVFGGIYYAVSGSSPDGKKKAKKMVTYAILGLALILISYSVLAVIDQILVQP